MSVTGRQIVQLLSVDPVFVTWLIASTTMYNRGQTFHANRPCHFFPQELTNATPLFRTCVDFGRMFCGHSFAQESASSVTLGDPSLTAGIPGVGLLTDDELTRWLDDPANHAVLNVALPEGLSAASANIFIPDDNPMTRAKIELGRQLYFDEAIVK